jgi:hypothetical protein
MALILLLLGSLTGYCVWLARTLRWPAAAMPLFTICSLTLFLYAAALADLLRGACTLAFAGGLLLLGALVLRPGRRAALQTLATPGLAIWLLLALLAWPRLSTAAYHDWDEFTHWGRASREVWLRGGLVPASSSVLCKDYPPGTALFHTFVSSVIGYSEGATYYAHALLLLAGMVTSVAYLGWRTWGALLFGVGLCYWALFAIGQGFLSLYADHVLGVLAGAAVGHYWVSRDRGDGAVWRVLPVVTCLVLVKQMGMVFAGLAVALVLSDQLRIFFRNPPTAPAASTRRAATLAALAALALLPLAVKGTWSLYLHRQGIGPTFVPRASTTQVVRGLLTPHEDPHRDRIVAAFSTALLRPPVYGARAGVTVISDLLPAVVRDGSVVGRGLAFGIATGLLVLLILGVADLLLEPSRTERRDRMLLQAWLALGAAGYLVLLLAAYVYAFGTYQGVRLNSYDRYASSYLLAWSWVTICVMLAGLRREGRRRKATVALCSVVALLALLTAPWPSRRFLLRPVRGPSQERTAVQQALSPLLGTPAGTRVYHVWQNSDGFAHYLSTYELTPRFWNFQCWSLGEPYGADDDWTCALPPDELARILRGYDYLFLGRTDGMFWERYGSLFEKREPDAPIWRVERTATLVRLRPWPEAP